MYRPLENFSPLIPSKKLSGPFRATQIWNEIVEIFTQNMPRKTYRRQLKLHHHCFTATGAVDFLYEVLKRNENTPENVTRKQAIKLLDKFLQSHIIENAVGRWRDITFDDDSQLYRICTSDGRVETRVVDERPENHNRFTLCTLNVIPSSFKLRRKHNNDSERKSSKPRRSRSLYEKRHDNAIANSEVAQKLRNSLIQRLQNVLAVKLLDGLISAKEIEDDWIRRNVNEVGKSGVVQVSSEEDIPNWTLRAMVCLATWPREKEKGLPQYAGFERDILNTISNYYCEGENFLTRDLQTVTSPGNLTSLPDEPLLTSAICQALAKVGRLTPGKLCETLQLCLLLISPSKRRKLHLLVRFMAKVVNNPHLASLDDRLCTKELLFRTFSKCIFAFDDVIEWDLLSSTVASVLIENHAKIFKVPETLIEKNELRMPTTDRRCKLRRANSLDTLKAVISGSKSMLSAQKLSEKLWKSRRRQRVVSTSVASPPPSVSSRRRCMTVSCSFDLNKSFKNKLNANLTVTCSKSTSR